MLYDKGSLRPILRRTTSTTANEILHVNIMPSGGITLNIVLEYQYPRITLAEEMLEMTNRTM